MPEEPDERMAHVRICGGGGWVTTKPTRKNSKGKVEPPFARDTKGHKGKHKPRRTTKGKKGKASINHEEHDRAKINPRLREPRER